MEFVVPRPAAINYFLIGCPLGIALVALALRRVAIVQRVLLVAIVSAACLLFHLFGPQPMRFAWNEQGIVDETFGDARRIAWSDVRELRLIRACQNSEFRPTRRTNGAAYDGYGSGTFTLANGTSARVFFTPQSSDALLLTTATETYLYAPPSFAQFRQMAESRCAGRAGP